MGTGYRAQALSSMLSVTHVPEPCNMRAHLTGVHYSLVLDSTFVHVVAKGHCRLAARRVAHCWGLGCRHLQPMGILCCLLLGLLQTGVYHGAGAVVEQSVSCAGRTSVSGVLALLGAS